MDKNYEPTLLLTLLLPAAARRARAPRAGYAPARTALPDEATMPDADPRPSSDDDSSDRPAWVPQA